MKELVSNSNIGKFNLFRCYSCKFRTVNKTFTVSLLVVFVLITVALICISDPLMTGVVNSFVMRHWAVARKMVDSHVSKHTTNVVSVEIEEADKQPKEVYEHLNSINVF